MKVDEAYSLDYEDIIDAEKAHELYWEDIIKNKRNFECADANCNAQITCAGIDIDREELKKAPHFRVYSDHSPRCSLKPNKKEKRDAPLRTDDNPMKYIDKSKDIFLIDRPKQEEMKVETKKDSKDRINHKDKKKKIQEEFKDGIKRIPKYSTIKPLITKFERYSEEGTIDKCYINVKGMDISYKEMFIKVNKTEIEHVSKYDRVYFGEGSVYSPKGKEDYVIKFKEPMVAGKVECRPTIYIPKTLIDKHYQNRKWTNKLNELKSATKKDNIIFFIYGKPYEVSKIIEGEEVKFINFSLKSMDHLDARYL